MVAAKASAATAGDGGLRLIVLYYTMRRTALVGSRPEDTSACSARRTGSSRALTVATRSANGCRTMAPILKDADLDGSRSDLLR